MRTEQKGRGRHTVARKAMTKNHMEARRRRVMRSLCRGVAMAAVEGIGNGQQVGSC